MPRPAHAKLMGLERIGRVELDPVRVAPTLSRWAVADAIRCDWTIAYAGRSTESLPRGVALSTLLRDPA